MLFYVDDNFSIAVFWRKAMPDAVLYKWLQYHWRYHRVFGINIVIEDTGGGIMPTHLQNILTAFRQDNSSFARSRDCVGLGLALSKEIVKLHQGRIEIDEQASGPQLCSVEDSTACIHGSLGMAPPASERLGQPADPLPERRLSPDLAADLVPSLE